MLARYSLQDGGTDANKWLMQMAEAIGGYFAKQEAGTDDDVMRQQQDNTYQASVILRPPSDILTN